VSELASFAEDSVPFSCILKIFAAGRPWSDIFKGRPKAFAQYRNEPPSKAQLWQLL